MAWVWVLGGVLALGAAFFFLRPTNQGSPTRPFVGGDLHSLVVDPSNPSRLYVGGHHGVAVSANQGKAWQRLDSLDGADAMGWAFFGDRALVGGHPGLYVSEDGGRTFERRNEGLPDTDIHGLGAGENVIYAASPQAGVFASTDGGRTWEIRTDRFGQAVMGRILVDPNDEDRVLTTDMQNGLVESTDGGRSWRVLGAFPGAMWATWDQDETDHVIVAVMGQASETTDGGRTWQPMEVPADVSVVEMSPGDPETLFAAALDGQTAGVWVSRDGGETWARP